MTGKYLKDKIKEAGYDLSQIASDLNISPQNLQNRLKSKDIKVEFLFEIAQKINKSVYDLLPPDQKKGFKNVNNPPSTQEKSGHLSENMQIGPPTQEGFGQYFGHSLARNEQKRGGKSVKNEMSKCEKCEEKERVIKAMEGQIEVLKDALKGKQILVDEKERMIQKLERENTQQERTSSKQHRRAG